MCVCLTHRNNMVRQPVCTFIVSRSFALDHAHHTWRAEVIVLILTQSALERKCSEMRDRDWNL